MRDYVIKLEIEDAIKNNYIKKLELIKSRYPVEFEKFVLGMVR